MSEIYSSSSGSYQNYLSQRQTDEIKSQITKETNKQLFVNGLNTMYISRNIQNMGKNIDNSIQRMSTGIQTKLQENTYAVVASTAILKNTFEAGFDSINNTLDLGFAGVSKQIGAIGATMSAGFDKLSKTLDYWGTEICEKLDAIHDIVNNPLLTASRELYRRACQNTTKKFYEEDLEDIKGAIEKNKTDYISWGLLGKLYLFGISDFSNVVDVPKAVDAFTNACKYITPDIDESDTAKMMASEFYFYLAFADYILSNENRLENNSENVTKYLQDSVKANAKAYALSNQMNEALYNQARSNCLLGNKEEALKLCKQVIVNDGLYALKATSDDDLKDIQNELFAYLKSEIQRFYTEIKNLVDSADEKYIFFDTPIANKVKKEIEKYKSLSTKTPYLDMRNAAGATKSLFNKIQKQKLPLDYVSYQVEFLKAGKEGSNGIDLPNEGKKLWINSDIFDTSESEERKEEKLDYFLKQYNILRLDEPQLKKVDDHERFDFVLEYDSNRIYLRNQKNNEVANYVKYYCAYAKEVYNSPNHIGKHIWKPENGVEVEFTLAAKDASFTTYDKGEFVDYKEFTQITAKIKRCGVQVKEVYEKELENAKKIEEENNNRVNREIARLRVEAERAQKIKELDKKEHRNSILRGILFPLVGIAVGIGLYFLGKVIPAKTIKRIVFYLPIALSILGSIITISRDGFCFNELIGGVFIALIEGAILRWLIIYKIGIVLSPLAFCIIFVFFESDIFNDGILGR